MYCSPAFFTSVTVSEFDRVRVISQDEFSVTAKDELEGPLPLHRPLCHVCNVPLGVHDLHWARALLGTGEAAWFFELIFATVIFILNNCPSKLDPDATLTMYGVIVAGDALGQGIHNSPIIFISLQ